MLDNDATSRLRELLARADTEWTLAEAALLLARDEYPGLAVDSYLEKLDAFAGTVRQRLPEQPSLEDRLVALNEFLFDEQGFAGNTDDYYDPRNSFLNEVLDRRLGIPITLSILYIELARRLDVELEGVSFPGHFLVKLPTPAGDMVLDPFYGGTPLSEEDLAQRLNEAYGERAPRISLPELLVSADKRDILVRMLRNLKIIYLQNGRAEKALDALHRVLLIDPRAVDDRRERGELHEKLECLRAAADDYRHYLRLAPKAVDTARIRQRLIELEHIVSRYN